MGGTKSEREGEGGSRGRGGRWVGRDAGRKVQAAGELKKWQERKDVEWGEAGEVERGGVESEGIETSGVGPRAE